MRCLSQHAKWTEAQRVLQTEVALLPQLPYVGPLHQALLFKTSAQLAWALRDLQTWRAAMRDFWRLVWQADLRHQARSVRKLYGPSLEPLLTDLRSEWGVPADG